jgi:hypothetical protein
VTIAEQTQYPFGETIDLKLAAPRAVRFPLYLRVPGWCQAAAVKLNGKPLDAAAKGGWFVRIDRTWAPGDTLSLELPMNITLTRWARNKKSVSVNRGPLTYSLKIGEKIVRVGGTDKWPALEIHPTGPWNYGLVLGDENPASSIEVAARASKLASQPFRWDAAPIELRAKAKKIPGWKQDSLGLVGLLGESPVKSDEPVETVALIPMGCARLRIASFPTIGTAPAARDWPQ